jgi:hypothetical protein
MTTARTRRRRRPGVLRRHALGLIVFGILLVWLVLYVRGDPDTRIGAFYGNALADWLGTFVIVIATKYLFEIGSAESRSPHPRSRGLFMRLLIDHSLTIGLLATGAFWWVLYVRLPVNAKSGQVVGNILSEWTQIFGLVVITKYFREIGSKEGN